MTRRMVAPLIFGIARGRDPASRSASGRCSGWPGRPRSSPRSTPASPPRRCAVPARARPGGATATCGCAAEGAIEPGELHVYTSAPPRGVGYRVIAPLRARRRAAHPARPRLRADRREGRGPAPRTDRRRGQPRLAAGDRRFTSRARTAAKNIWFARDVPLMAEALGTVPVMLVVAASDDPAAPMPLPVTREHPERPPAVRDHLVRAGGGLGDDDRLPALAYQAPDRLRDCFRMHYISTRGAAPTLGFEAAMLAGLARDGGLYVPETWPTADAAPRSPRLAGPALRGGRLPGDAALHRRRLRRRRVPRHHRPRLRRLRPCRAGAAGADRAERLAARALPRADARLQGRGDAADRRSSSRRA